ncbi:FadD3 family acyl-CoA ligase [Jatrophihabitans sp.]|uniref:FadD3 family acyl-CoA ligase n=1 Tax=Jatrophihabitans sp. TaxID=1932789 RepID=UPI0030C77B39|nr:putative fatty-acid--CoA ligase [Jatrophihabitans sp.]
MALSTVPQALSDAAATHPEAEAVADGPVRLTFAELLDQVRTAARFYLAQGVQPGEHVAVWAPNTYRWVIAALGVHYAGATLVPINTRYTAHEALDILERTRAAALVVAGPFLGVDRLAELARLTDKLPPTLVLADRGALGGPERPVEPRSGVTAWDELAAAAASVSVETADAAAAAVTPDDVSDVLFTSGTTGRSKGVQSAHRQALDVARAWAECGEVGPTDRYLIINPFFHSFGYKAGILVGLLTGATIVPMAVYDPEAAMALVQDERISVLPGAPTIYQTILDHPRRGDYDLSSLRFAVTGAAVVPVTLIERMQSELDIDIVLTAFGMTEAVVVTMCRRDDPPEVVARTCGRVTAGFEARIGEQGELLLRGPNVMLGYLDDPAATAEAIDADGWLHTGDVGTIDEAGYLRITDRLKDMYISGGFNVYPAEVEQTLARLAGVAEVAVIGVPDERLGEVGLAVVVALPGATLTSPGIVAFCREQLANFKVPRRVEFRTTPLPRNPSGKVLKTVLREDYS